MPEAGHKFSVTVRHDTKRHTMQPNYLFHVQVSQLLRVESNLNGLKIHALGQPIHYDPNTIMLLDSFWNSDHKMHGDVFPFPHRNQ